MSMKFVIYENSDSFILSSVNIWDIVGNMTETNIVIKILHRQSLFNIKTELWKLKGTNYLSFLEVARQIN